MPDMAHDSTFHKQTEEALRESEEHFRLVLKNAPVTIAVQDRDLRFLWAFNQRTIPPAEIIGKTDRDLFPPETAEPLIALKRRVLETGSELHEQLWVTSGGKRLFLDLFLEPWRNAAGRIVGIRIATVDLTAMKSAQEALEESERNLRRTHEILEAVTAGTEVIIAAQDLDFRYLFFNRAYQEEIKRLTGKELQIGMSMTELFSHMLEAREVAVREWSRVLGGEARSHTIEFGDPGRYCRIYSVRHTPLRDSGGGVVGAGEVAHDVTEQIRLERELREKEERLAHALEAGELGSWGLDVKTGLAWRSLRHDRIFGYEKLLPEWTYHMFLEHVLPEDRPEVDRKFGQAIAENTEWNFECRICRIDGEIRWIWAQGRPRLNERHETEQMIGLVKDITEKKKIEEETLRIKEELEQRVLVRTNQLRALTLELTRAEQKERKRLAGVLHDNLQQLLVGIKWGLQEAQRKARGKELQQSLSQTAELLDESIRASKSLAVELSPPILHETGLTAALGWLARWMKEKHDLTVHIAADLEIQPDPEGVCQLLFQSVRELLFNVVKHSQTREADITIKESGQQIEIRVADRGVGVNVIELQERETESGYGLFSIRERLSLLGGRMTIESGPEAGTVVTLRAPLPRPVPAAGKSAAPAAAADQEEVKTGTVAAKGPKIRVLVVDDHKIMREGLSRLLQSLPDMEVVGEAPDGKTALDMARELRPNIVIMDISMPHMNGIEATRRITAEVAGVKVIGLSMYEEEDRAKEMIEAGAVDYFNKAGPAQDLVASIRVHHGMSKED